MLQPISTSNEKTDNIARSRRLEVQRLLQERDVKPTALHEDIRRELTQLDAQAEFLPPAFVAEKKRELLQSLKQTENVWQRFVFPNENVTTEPTTTLVKEDVVPEVAQPAAAPQAETCHSLDASVQTKCLQTKCTSPETCLKLAADLRAEAACNKHLRNEATSCLAQVQTCDSDTDCVAKIDLINEAKARDQLQMEEDARQKEAIALRDATCVTTFPLSQSYQTQCKAQLAPCNSVATCRPEAIPHYLEFVEKKARFPDETCGGDTVEACVKRQDAVRNQMCKSRFTTDSVLQQQCTTNHELLDECFTASGCGKRANELGLVAPPVPPATVLLPPPSAPQTKSEKPTPAVYCSGHFADSSLLQSQCVQEQCSDATTGNCAALLARYAKFKTLNSGPTGYCASLQKEWPSLVKPCEAASCVDDVSCETRNATVETSQAWLRFCRSEFGTSRPAFAAVCEQALPAPGSNFASARIAMRDRYESLPNPEVACSSDKFTNPELANQCKAAVVKCTDTKECESIVSKLFANQDALLFGRVFCLSLASATNPEWQKVCLQRQLACSSELECVKQLVAAKVFSIADYYAFRYSVLAREITNLDNQAAEYETQITQLQTRIAKSGGAPSTSDRQKILQLSDQIRDIQVQKDALQATSDQLNTLRGTLAPPPPAASTQKPATSAVVIPSTKPTIKATPLPKVPDTPQKVQLLNELSEARSNTLRKVVPRVAPAVGPSSTTSVLSAAPFLAKETTAFESAPVPWFVYIADFTKAREIFADAKKFPRRSLGKPFIAYFDQVIRTMPPYVLPDAQAVLKDTLLPIPKEFNDYALRADPVSQRHLDQFLDLVYSQIATFMLRLNPVQTEAMLQECLKRLPNSKQQMEESCTRPQDFLKQYQAKRIQEALFSLSPLQVWSQIGGATGVLRTDKAATKSRETAANVTLAPKLIEDVLSEMEKAQHTFNLRTKEGSTDQALTHSHIYDSIPPKYFNDVAPFLNNGLRLWLTYHLEHTTLKAIREAIGARSLWCQRNISASGTTTSKSLIASLEACENEICISKPTSEACNIAKIGIQSRRQEQKQLETSSETKLADVTSCEDLRKAMDNIIDFDASNTSLRDEVVPLLRQALDPKRATNCASAVDAIRVQVCNALGPKIDGVTC